MQKFSVLVPNICEDQIEDNKAYILTVKEKLKLGYTEALFCKSRDCFYFLPMDRFLGSLISYRGDYKIKIISKKKIENVWTDNKKDIEKKYKIDNLIWIQEYMYAFIYCLDHVDYTTIELDEFEEKIIDSYNQ